MTEFDAAFRLMDVLDERTAERVEPTPYGPVLVHERLHKVHDLNFLRAEAPGEASVEQLAAEAERVQGAAGIGHRRVNFRDVARAERLEPDFVARSWEPQRFVLMALHREPDAPASVTVREVDETTIRPLWAEVTRTYPHSKDEELVRQIIEHHRLIAAALPTRLFAVEAEGRLVAHTELYSLEGVGQVENVATLPDYRGRGFARALVLRAIEASRADGNELTFLVASEDDWPRQLYEKLGFDVVGRYVRFLKLLPGVRSPS